MTDDSPVPPEFSRLVPVSRLGPAPARYEIEAGPEERQALALRFDLVAIDRLSATVTLERRPGGAVRLSATLEARITQSCVVTLEPVPAAVSDRFTLLYRPDIDEEAADRLALEHPEDESVEPLAGDAIDIGEAVAQELAVAMDPFPRAPEAEATVEALEREATRGAAHPFDALAPLRKPS